VRAYGAKLTVLYVTEYMFIIMLNSDGSSISQAGAVDATA